MNFGFPGNYYVSDHKFYLSINLRIILTSTQFLPDFMMINQLRIQSPALILPRVLEKTTVWNDRFLGEFVI